jgi:AraC-like DNA-binding protein
VPAAVAQDWQQQYGTEALNIAYQNTPLYEPRKIEDIMGLLSMMVKYVASQNMIHISNSPIGPLIQYIDDHPEDMLSLQEAASLVHRSVSSLSHLFKKTTGKGFRQYQIEKKLDQADAYFRTSQELSVSQVAVKLGYEDPLYFSKLYKKHRGYPPVRAIKEFRASFSSV